jgi:hypothetical protein
LLRPEFREETSAEADLIYITSFVAVHKKTSGKIAGDGALRLFYNSPPGILRKGQQLIIF